MREIQDIHEPFIAWLNKARVPFHRNRSDKKTTAFLGDPDFLITALGRCLYIECKVPGATLSEKQENRILYLRKAGNTVLICYSAQMAIDAVVKLLWMDSLSSSGEEKQSEDGIVVSPHPQNFFIARIGLINYVMEGKGIPGTVAKRVRVATPADLVSIK